MRNAPIIQSHSNAATYNFPALYAAQWCGISVLAVQGDSTAVGTVKLQASNDFSPGANLSGDFVPSNWVDIPNTSQNVTSGGAVLIPYTQIAYQWVRVVWTEGTPGTSTITAEINVQSV